MWSVAERRKWTARYCISRQCRGILYILVGSNAWEYEEKGNRRMQHKHHGIIEKERRDRDWKFVKNKRRFRRCQRLIRFRWAAKEKQTCSCRVSLTHTSINGNGADDGSAAIHSSPNEVTWSDARIDGSGESFLQDGRKCCSSPNGRDFLVVNSQGRAPQKSRHGSSWINIVTTMFQLEGMATFSFYSSATKERFWQRRENAFQLEMRARFYWAEIWISLRGNFITFGNQNEIWLTHLQMVLSFGNNENEAFNLIVVRTFDWFELKLK